MLPWLKRNSGILSGALLLCIALGAGFLLLRQPTAEARPVQISPPASRQSGTATASATPARTQTPTRTPTPTRTATPVPVIMVQIDGAVERPGIYVLQQGARTLELVTAAGGFAPDADTPRVNMTHILKDGELIVIARQSARAGTSIPLAGGTPQGAAGKVNINTANATELERLPGIGPQLAAQIIAYRQARGPFERIEDLDKVPGIGPATIERLRDLIVLR